MARGTILRARRRASAGLSAVAVAAGVLLVPGTDTARAAPNQYVTMPDGVRIAVNVRLPDTYVPGKRYPTLFEMSGYDGGSAEDGTLAKDYGIPGAPQEDSRQLTRTFNAEYVTVHASVRGSGCSGGEFDLFSWQSALDGKQIIDGWIPTQPWSNGDVAIMGHSYSGITGFMVAATRPAHLRAATVSGLIDDLYRGITYPGGVSNYGFPLAWTGGIRPAYDVLGGLAPGIVREEEADDVPGRRQMCAENVTTKRRAATEDPLVRGLDNTDGPWWQARSLINYAHLIDVPLHVTGAYQDEQTGPRGPTHLWETVQGVPKRLVLSNGDHNTQNPSSAGPEIRDDRKAWIDHWMGLAKHKHFGAIGQDLTSVTTLLETHRQRGTLTSNGRIDTLTYPHETTQFTDYYLGVGGTLSTTPPVGPQPGDSYIAGSPRQSWNYQAGPSFGPPFTTASGPDEVAYRTAPVTEPTAFAGPLTATLWVQSSAPDTELFVQLIDEGPNGEATYLQRGMLKASHRAVDAAASDYAGGRLYRPHRPHTLASTAPVIPGEAVEYLVEVFPVGHVLRPGHRLMMKVHTPPLVDSYYVYVPGRAPAVNTVLHDAAHPSRLMVPLVPLTGVTLGPALPCGAQEAMRCIARPQG